MSIGINASIPTTGLALACDMANTQKSFRGQPTTNYFGIPTPDSSGNVTFPVQGTGTFQRIYAGTYGGYTIQPTDIVYKYVLGLAPTGCHYHGNTISVTTGQTPTWSFDYYIDGSTTGYPVTNYLANMESSVGVGLALTDPTPTSIGVWKRVTGTSAAATSNGTFNAYLYPGACGTQLATGGFILYKNPQVELNSFATPFTTSTRTTSQAVIDLTGNNMLTATSLTYNSDGTYSFNGSTNRIVTNGNITYGNNTTWEAWVYCTSNISTYNMFIGRYLPYFGFYSGNSLYFSNSVNSAQVTIQTPTTLSLNTWYHATFTTAYNGTNTVMSIYVNGVLTTTNTFTGAQTGGAAQFAIGDGQASQWYPFPGKIGAVKVYDRTLTADEILQNFSATRGRYGI